MKTEINLRPREFVVSRELYWPRLVATIVGALLIAVALVGGILGYLYIYNLQNEITYLAIRAEELRLRAAPAIQLQQAIGRVRERADLEYKLLENVPYWSTNLREIEEAAGKGIAVNRVSGGADGRVTVTGHSKTLKDVGVYLQELGELEFIDEVTIGYINLEQEEQFAFTMNATMVVEGGPESDE